VDDFLDEVVVELRRLNQENEELRQRLVQSDSRINDLQRQAAAAPPQQVAQPQLQAPSYAQPEPVAAPPIAAPAPAPAYGAAPGIDAASMDPSNTNNLLQLARRLHEEHVREGVEKRDALIAEGHATAARLVADAEQKQRAQIGALDQERQALEGRIDELRTFEREYRQKLRGYIEGQLRELESANSISASSQVPAAVTSGPPSQPQPVQAQPAQQPYQPQPAQQYPAPVGQPPVNFSGFAGN
jgi:cell division septum initiation protein DivIVA